jgi:hypothetical protein
MPVDLKTVPGTGVIGKVIKQNGIGFQMKMRDRNKKDTRVYVLRNDHLYTHLSKRQLYVEYERQLQVFRSGMKLSSIQPVNQQPAKENQQ